MKRKSNEMTLKEAINRMMEAYRLGDKMIEIDTIKNWEEMMGAAVGKRTREIYIKNKILYLRIDSAPLKEELLMNKSLIIERLNEKAGKKIIDDVYFL